MNTPEAPTLTVLDGDPCPRVLIHVDNLDGVLVTVTRNSDGEIMPVLDANNVAHAGQLTVVDYLAPGGTVTYQAQVFSDTDSSPLGAAASVTVPIKDVWIQDPLDPASAVTVELRGTALQGVSRQLDMETLDILGRARPIIQTFGAKAIDDLPFQFLTTTAEQASAVRKLIQGAPLAVRTPAGGLFADIPRLLFCAIQAKCAWTGWIYNQDSRDWDATATEVASQTIGVQIHPVSWQTYLDAYSIWQDTYDVYQSWNDSILNPPGGF